MFSPCFEPIPPPPLYLLTLKLQLNPFQNKNGLYKTTFEMENYLLLNLPRKVQKQLSKYRLSAHNLEIENRQTL